MKHHSIISSILFILIIILFNRIPFDNVIDNFNISQFESDVLSKILKNSLVVIFAIWILWKYKIPLQLINRVSSKNFIYFIPLLLFIILLLNGSENLNKLDRVGFNKLSLYSIDIFIAALLEEIVFRGLILGLIIQQFIYRQNGILISVFISGLLFGAVHIINYWTLDDVSLRNILNQVYAAIGLGILFSAIYLKNQNLLLLILIHFGINFISMSDNLFPEPYKVDIESAEVNMVNLVIEELIRIIFFGIPILVGYFIIRKTTKDEIQFFLKT